MALTPAEQKVRKLARLPGNCVCPNCGTTKTFGFSTVCIKYFTFVCNDCKSSHQAISHRCKSLTMSSWSDQEVAELLSKGNDYARRTWLKNAPPVGTGGRPREGDHIDVFKRFVVDVYERKRHFGEDDGAQPAHAVAEPSTRRAPQVVTAIPLAMPPSGSVRTLGMPPAAIAAPRAPVRAPAPVPPPAPVADLLDFSSTMPTPTAMATSSASFEPDFDAFGLTVGPATAAPSTPPAPASVYHDPFQPAPATAPAASSSSGSAFEFISATTTPTPMTTVDASYMSAPAPATAAKKPVMSNHSMSGTSSFISNMNLPAPQHGGGGGGGGGGNFNVMMNSNMQGFGGGGMSTQNNPMMMMQPNAMMHRQMMMMPQQQQLQQNTTGINVMSMNSMNNMGMSMNNNRNLNSGLMNTTNVMGGNPMMSHQHQLMMMNGNFGGGAMNSSNGNKDGKLPSSMNSLDMNISSMNAWTSGSGK